MAAPPQWPEYLHSYHDARPGITEALLRRCAPDPYDWLLAGTDVEGLRVLDLACGSAPLQPRLVEARYVGVDTSQREVRLAADRDRGPVVQAHAGRLPLADASVDLVVCSMALQVLTPLPVVLDELRRVLRPSGRLVAMVPVSRPLTMSDRVRYSRILWRLRRARLGYANAGVRDALTRAGWRIVGRQARRFAYPLRSPADGRRLIEAFYLPDTADGRRDSAIEMVSRWHGIDLGIPLQQLVAAPP